MTNWSKLVEEHGSIVWNTAYRLLNHDADAADCFQRTFIAALAVARSQAVRSWPALLRRIATARALEQIRQRIVERSRTAPLDNSLDRDPKAPEPRSAAQANELAEHLRLALAQIDERQAEAFCLATFDELSYQQIAEQIGTTVNHVGVLIHRAKADLRERLKAHAPAPRPARPSPQVQP